MAQFLDDTQRDIVLRANQLQDADLDQRLTDVETQLNTALSSAASTSVTTSVEPGIVNQLRNTDCKHSNNTWFETSPGSGKTASELAYFFTNAIDATVIEHTDALTNPSDTATSAIKSSDHPDFGSNIQNPKWDKEFGTIVFGKTNTIDLPLGFFSADGASFVDSFPIRQGDPMFVCFKIARKSNYVRPRGRLYIELCNNNPSAFGPLKGAAYGLAGARRGQGVPATSVSTQYMIALEIDQGYTLVSQVVTIADSPNLASMNINCYNLLQWSYIAGTRAVRIFRKFGTGNVFEINENPQGQNSYPDKGVVSSTDTGSTSFPTFADQKDSIDSYWASSEVQLQNIAVDGVAASWDLFGIWITVPSSLDLSAVIEPFLRIGLTEAGGVMVRDAVTNSTGVVTSAAAQFTTEMVGKTFNLRNPATGDSLTGTVTSYDSDTQLTLSASVPFTATDCVLEIQDCIDDALEIDKIGLSFSNGVWTPNPDDLSDQRQTPASLPPSSNQGDGSIGTGGGGDPVYGGGFGGNQCVWEDSYVHVMGPEETPIIQRAKEIQVNDKLWFGRKDKRGKYIYNDIEEINVSIVPEMVAIETKNGCLFCTESHRMIGEDLNFKDGIPVAELSKHDCIFRFCPETESFVAEPITIRRLMRGEFRVFSFKLKAQKTKAITAHLMMANFYLSHNLKREPDESLVNF